jgi:predicted small lipoprotein YifL
MSGKLVTRFAVLMLIATVLASGCGNKGDLVLPDAGGEQVPRSGAGY